MRRVQQVPPSTQLNNSDCSHEHLGLSFAHTADSAQEHLVMASLAELRCMLLTATVYCSLA